MTMKEAVSLAELAARLYGADYAGTPGGAAQAARALFLLARKVQRHAERLCNEPVDPAEDDAIKSRLRARFSSIQSALGGIAARNGLRAEFDWDPRGCCLHLFGCGLPGNTWGGEEAGYGVGA